MSDTARLKNEIARRFGRSMRRGKPSLVWAVATTVAYGGSRGKYWDLPKAVLRNKAGRPGLSRIWWSI